MVRLFLSVAAGALLVPSAWSQTPAPVPPPTAATTPPPAPAADAAEIAKMRAQLQDWAGLSRYASADAALAPPAPGVQRVVFMGDSITDGWGRWTDTGTFFPGKPYVNRGISGQTTEQMVVRFQQDVVALKPAAVLILAGTNDIAGNTGPESPQTIEDELTSMAEIANSSGIKVILASITPVAVYPWRPAIHPADEIRAINAWIRNFCVLHGYTYLDYYSAMAGPDGGMRPGISKDGVHPNTRGYAIMAPLAEQAIAKTLAK